MSKSNWFFKITEDISFRGSRTMGLAADRAWSSVEDARWFVVVDDREFDLFRNGSPGLLTSIEVPPSEAALWLQRFEKLTVSLLPPDIEALDGATMTFEIFRGTSRLSASWFHGAPGPWQLLEDFASEFAARFRPSEE